jgi:hypothetical protein
MKTINILYVSVAFIIVCVIISRVEGYAVAGLGDFEGAVNLGMPPTPCAAATAAREEARLIWKAAKKHQRQTC